MAAHPHSVPPSALVLALCGAFVGCATEPRCGRDLSALDVPPTFAVVLTDYASSAVALLDARGDVIEPAWVTSGSHAPLLVTPISGDVVLPQTALGGGTLAWIDRYSVDVMTLVAMPGGAVIAQLDLRGDREGARTGFSPNPQDALTLPDGRVLVSRHNPNRDPGAPEIALGNDLVALDRATGEMTRVALACDASDGETTYFARPADLALLTAGDRVVVVAGLGRLNDGFTLAGPGAIAAIDAHTLAPMGCLELGPLEDCTSVAVEPDAPARALVLCSGPTFDGEALRRAHAGVVEVELDVDGTLRERARALPAAGEPAPTGWLVATGAGRAVVVSDSRGDEPRPDQLLFVDVETGSSTVVAEGAAFALGLGAARGDLLLVPDADRSVVLRFDLAAAVPTLRDEVAIEGCSGLPARQVATVVP